MMGDTFAIQNDRQYQPVQAVADQRILVPYGTRTAWLGCFASRPLSASRVAGERVVVVVHGAVRNADRYLQAAQAAAQLSGSAALIVAPQFLTEADGPVPDGLLRWTVEGWKGGLPAAGPALASSFTAMDCLLAYLALGRNRPGEIVIVGNSAGGQFVNRYAAAGLGPDLLAAHGIPVRFVISNPSTYLYFSQQRPFPVPGDRTVNRWRYGFDGAPEYVTDNPWTCLARYLRHDITIALGEQDDDPAASLLEVSPAAAAQGRNRLERGLCYRDHLRQAAQAAWRPPARDHRWILLPGVGHEVADVLAAEPVRAYMFG